MSDLEFLKRNACRYSLEAKFVNDDTLQVYSPKFCFDNWLIKEKDNKLELWHLSKRNNMKKCSYHLQKVIHKKNKIRILQKINSHNKYVAFHKHKKRVNLVDRVLSKNNKIELS